MESVQMLKNFTLSAKDVFELTTTEEDRFDTVPNY
jgi:hypothetical protein